MTEAEWIACTETGPMLEFLRDHASDRKLRLYATACCRLIWHSLHQEKWRSAVEIAERYADRLASADELIAACRHVFDWEDLREQQDFESVGRARMVGDAARIPLTLTYLPWGPPALIRDLLGNPFRPVTIDSAWLTTRVIAIAEGIYEDRAFDRLPRLADVLEESGSDDAEILDHCRSPAEHVRGCWVVDVLLGKE